MIDQIQDLLKSNPIIAGGAGMALVGWLLMQAKTLPLKLLRLIQDQFSTTVTIYSEDSIFRLVDLWLARHPSAKHSRRFSVADWHNKKTGEDDYSLSPGAGIHLLRSGWKFFLVHRHIEDKGADQEAFGNGRRRKQTISITVFGRKPNPLYDLLVSMKTIHEDHESIPVFIWNGHDYSLIERRMKRPMDTVYASEEIKRKLIDDLTRFRGRRDWYVERGVPYRRGYLFEGPPGTGKTTMIFALASLFNVPVYIINPAAVENDSVLQRAVNSAGSNFVVIEDIDALEAAEEREKKTTESRSNAEASKSGITTSGLLNALDGIGAREGRVLFITSNHAHVLDAALIRPGRVDLRVHLGESTITEATAMFERWFPDGDVREFQAEIESHLPITPAALQNKLLGLSEVAA